MFDRFQPQTPSASRRRRLALSLAITGGIAALIAVLVATQKSPTDDVHELSSPPMFEGVVMNRPTPPPPPLHPTALGYIYGDLPGMNVELPAASMMWDSPGYDTSPAAPPTIVGDYGTGQITQGSDVSWLVTWRPGPLADPEDERASAEAFLRNDQLLAADEHVPAARAFSLGGAPAFRIDAQFHDGAYLVAASTCGGRDFTITAAGPAYLAADRFEHMLATFHCTADPGQPLGQVASVTVDVVPGWSRLAPGSTSIVDGRGTVLRLALWNVMANTSPEDHVRKGLNVSAANLTSQLPQRLANDHLLWRARDADDPPSKTPYAVVSFPCPDGQHIGMIWILSLNDAEKEIETGIALAKTGRCTASGETPPELPILRSRK